MNEIEVAGQFDQMNRVIEEMLKGNNPTQIAKDLGLHVVKGKTYRVFEAI